MTGFGAARNAYGELVRKKLMRDTAYRRSHLSKDATQIISRRRDLLPVHIASN